MDFNELDLSGQQEDLLRRKAIVEALQAQQSMPGQSLKDLTGAWFGRNLDAGRQQQIEAYQRDSQAYRQRERQVLESELTAFTERMNGKPSQPPAPYGDTGSVYGPPTPPVPANPREAVVRAMTSQLPEMQAMGKAAMSTMGKGAEWTPHVIGNQLVFTDKQGNERIGGTYNKADWVDEPRNMNGQTVLGQRNKQTNEWLPRTGNGTTINLDTKGQVAVQQDALEAMKTSRGQAMAAQEQIQSATAVIKLLDDPQVRTGFAANTVNGIAALGAKLGFNEGDSVAKTQALAGELAKNTLAMGQSMKGSFSDKDIEFLRQVSLGSVNFTPESLQRVASLAYAAGHNAIMNTTDQWQGASRIKGLEGAADVHPYPQVRYDASISDRPGFSMSSGGRLSYSGVPTQTPVTGSQKMIGGRRVISLQEFLNGAENAPN